MQSAHIKNPQTSVPTPSLASACASSESTVCSSNALCICPPHALDQGHIHFINIADVIHSNELRLYQVKHKMHMGVTPIRGKTNIRTLCSALVGIWCQHKYMQNCASWLCTSFTGGWRLFTWIGQQAPTVCAYTQIMLFTSLVCQLALLRTVRFTLRRMAEAETPKEQLIILFLLSKKILCKPK